MAREEWLLSHRALLLIHADHAEGMAVGAGHAALALDLKASETEEE